MTIDGLEVFEIRPDFSANTEVEVAGAVLGKSLGEARSFFQFPTQRGVHSLPREYVMSAAVAAEFEAFFDARAGQWQSFLVPSYCSELGVSETNSTDSSSGSADLYIDWCDYENTFEPIDGNLGRYIFILWDDGTFFATKVLSVTDSVEDDYDQLELDDNLPKDVDVDNPPMIGFLYQVRFASDELELEYSGVSRVSASAPMIETLISVPETDVS